MLDHKSIQAAAQHKTNVVSYEYNKIGVIFINVLHYKKYKQKVVSKQDVVTFV